MGRAPFGKDIETGGEFMLFEGKTILVYLLIINYLVNVRVFRVTTSSIDTVKIAACTLLMKQISFFL